MAGAASKITGATVVAATLDLGVNFVFWGLLKQVPAIRICQTIASGIYGKAAFTGGWQTAAVGVVAHYLIMLVMAVVLYVVMALVPVLKRLWLVTTLGYGLGTYAVMNYVVVPLSAAGRPIPWPPTPGIALWFNLFCHIVLVALVMVLFFKGSADGMRTKS